ncbi:hypothetical protein [Mesorhizobium sp. ZC-5]|uniref:hypothetical protein n=1 Tax=Mesorhizobium sp. ZC-5 TaxID=2986066 RepID=UPI0021E7A1B1|nr:hypothetical protein [Mesorhizobium sp. ZC-5]MCV3238906.1 hypothetical protein [Mesorhizobium sp. ZC-5]
MRGPALVAASIMLVVAAAAIAHSQETQPAPALAVDTATGLPEWEKVYAVFSHPRCANCHVDDNRPRWSGPEFPMAKVHGFNVQGGADGSGFGNPGLRCTTCHFATNSPMRHGPPGAESWHLAPPEMVWFGKSSAEICAQTKDPERNGDRTLEEIATHVRDDGLVGWGWDPGPGRQPAPGSAEQTFLAIQRWAAAGAPCP